MRKRIVILDEYFLILIVSGGEVIIFDIRTKESGVIQLNYYLMLALLS